MPKKILVADDEADVVHIITTSLEAKGYQVVSACNGREALKKALDEQPDLILLDVEMPQMSGLETLRKLKERAHDAVVVILSAKAEIGDMQAGWNLGVDLYLTKPFLPTELVSFVNTILEDNKPYSE